MLSAALPLAPVAGRSLDKCDRRNDVIKYSETTPAAVSKSAAPGRCKALTI